MPNIEVQNVLQPGRTYRVDAEKFMAMRKAFLAQVPSDAPGKTPAQIIAAARPMLPENLFPGGEKAGWWAKAEQLDLEAKGVIGRADAPPVRLWRV